MSWKIEIKDDKNEIWEHEIELIIKDLPDNLRKFIPKGETMKQSYGYPAYLTVSVPENGKFTISGSYVTNTPEDSKKFVEFVIDQLKKNGHHNFIVKLAKDSAGDLFGIMDFITKKFFNEVLTLYEDEGDLKEPEVLDETPEDNGKDDPVDED